MMMQPLKPAGPDSFVGNRVPTARCTAPFPKAPTCRVRTGTPVSVAETATGDTTNGSHLRQKAGSILPDDHTHYNNEALHSDSVVYNAERSMHQIFEL